MAVIDEPTPGSVLLVMVSITAVFGWDQVAVIGLGIRGICGP
jgi:hypothetical protein